MRYIYVFLVFIFWGPTINGQGSISGFVQDENGNAFEFATVALYQADSLITGTITNEQGNYLITDLPYGTYKLEATYLGYKTWTLDSVDLNSKTLALAPIALTSSAEQLNEVIITESQEFMKRRLDKKVVQVDRNLSASGGNLDDVLLNDPSFSIDSGGQISFRGSQNFKVLIDGRPSAVNGSEALQNIPASSIARIEIVTNPSAKYQADSEVGIINIVLKKEFNDGISGQTGLRYDHRNQGNSVLRLNSNFQAKFNRIHLYLSASASRDTIQLQGPTIIDIINENEDYAFHRDRIVNQLLLAKSVNIRSGIEVGLGQKNTLGLWGEIHIGNSNYNALAMDEDRSNDEPVVLGRLDYKNDRDAQHTQFTIEDRLKINDQKELHILADFSRSGTRRDNFRSYFTAPQTNPAVEILGEDAVFYQNEDRDRWHNELNYSNAFSHTSDLDFGLLHEYYERTNTIEEFNFDELIRDDSAKFKFAIYNAYANYSIVWKGMDFSVGSRFEYSTRKLEGAQNSSLVGLFPSLSIGKTFENDFSLTLHYSKRIRRPSARDLSPIILYSDNQVTWKGNPTLADAKVHNIGVGAQKQFEKTTLSAELFYRLADNGWFRILESVGENRFENYPIAVEHEQNTGMEFSANWKPSYKLGLTLNGTYFKQKIDNVGSRNDMATNSSRFVFSTNYAPMDNLKLQFDANYNGPTLYANSKIAETHFLNFAIEKRFPKTGLTLTLFANDFTGGNVYKQTYSDSSSNDNRHTLLVESYPSSTKYHGFHLRYSFRNFIKREVNPNFQFND